MAAKTKQSDSGDHHNVDMQFDPQAKTLSSGMVMNFSDYASLGLNINGKGKVSGQMLHTGDTHSFNARIKDNGAFQGTYSDTKRGLEIDFSGKGAKLVNGTVDSIGIRHKGDHHTTSLRLKNGKLSGYLTSQVTKDSMFRLSIADGKVVKGSYTHKGKKHSTKVAIDGKSWQASVSAGKGKGSISFSVKGGMARPNIKGKLALEF